jgi:hypothetical protein
MPDRLDAAARGFDETAALYERLRPGWPIEAIRDLGADRYTRFWRTDRYVTTLRA